METRPAIHKIVSLGVVFFLAVASGWAQHSSIDVKHYNFQLNLNDSTKVITGKARLTFRLLKTEKQVYFDFIGKENKGGEGMKVTAVKAENRLLKFTQDGHRLYVYFKTPVDSGQVRSIRILYQGVPGDGLIISRNKFGHRSFFADNWPERARYWLPCNDTPADKATVDFIVCVPAHYRVVGNGVKIGTEKLPRHRKRVHWKITHPIPTKVMAIGVADFAVQQVAEVKQIPIQTWVFQQNRKAGFSQYKIEKNILPFFINYLGAFPYKKLANVQSKTRFGGMEDASAIFYAQNSVRASSDFSRRNRIKLAALMAHETAHQWFGDAVTETGWAHLWLSEGFATYMADCYLKYQYGKSFFRQRLRHERETVLNYAQKRQTPVVDGEGAAHPMQLLNPNSYQKGAWVLRMLNTKLGDSIFRAGLRAFYQKYRDGNASTEDFKQVMTRVSGRSLHRFFKQWLYTPGHPKVKAYWQYLPKTKWLHLHIEQTQTPVFKFPLRIGIQKGTKRWTKVLRVNQKEADYMIVTPFSPEKVILDPRVELLFSGKVEEK